MITLYGWGPMFDCPSPSPFVMKADIQLQMLGVSFTRAMADLESVPKHKAPYIIDEGQLVEDSNFIRHHLETKLGRGLYDGMTGKDIAASWALERMAEGQLAKIKAYERWMKDHNFNKGPALFFSNVPENARDAVRNEVRENLSAMHTGEGTGRFTDEERMQLADWDIGAIAMHLGDQDYMFGTEPSCADASVAAVLIACGTEYFDTPLSGLVHKHANLVAYIDRMKTRYFANIDWPASYMMAAEPA
ncbi:MAG: glutathione S-transferase [Hyphomonas sp.]|nr:glutathione S-transferase [Hyphomonas sp.]